jgi:hypothetical protein
MLPGETSAKQSTVILHPPGTSLSRAKIATMTMQIDAIYENGVLRPSDRYH